MDPITPHLSHAERTARRRHLNGLILASPMKTYRTLTELGQAVFTGGAIPKKQKELTALAVSVATNCWE